MINFKKQYEDLHGNEVETIVYIAEKYASVLNEANEGIGDELTARQAAYDKELAKIADKDFMIVYGMRNNNKRLVRKYRSSEVMKSKSPSWFADQITFEHPENVLFMKMDKKAYEKMTLNEDMRYLPGVPSTILELEAASNGHADDPKITFILGPDAEKVGKLLGATDFTVSSYESYKNVKVAEKGPAAPRSAAINLPLFETRDGNKTYQECVDEDRILIITKGNENYNRSLLGATSIWKRENPMDKFRKMASWLGDTDFSKKFATIKMGDYKRLQKFIKNTNDLPTWDEYLSSKLSKDPNLVCKLFSLGTKRYVKDATSIFSSYTRGCYNTAVKVVENKFNNKPSDKQKQFIEDLKTCADVYDSSCNYEAADMAKELNHWLGLGVSPVNGTNNEVDLSLKTKYPWVNILNTYHCDEEEVMHEILKIVDRY